MNEEARGKALVSVDEVIYSHAVGIDSDNTAIRQWSGLQEHRKRLADLRTILRQEAARDIRIGFRRDIRRELNAKLRMVKEEQLNRLLAGCFGRGKQTLEMQLPDCPSSVEGLNPAPHIHEQMTTSNYGYDIAYNFTHNNIMLEPNAMNNMNTVAHMDVHNTQY